MRNVLSRLTIGLLVTLLVATLIPALAFATDEGAVTTSVAQQEEGNTETENGNVHDSPGNTNTEEGDAANSASNDLSNPLPNSSDLLAKSAKDTANGIVAGDGQGISSGDNGDIAGIPLPFVFGLGDATTVPVTYHSNNGMFITQPAYPSVTFNGVSTTSAYLVRTAAELKLMRDGNYCFVGWNTEPDNSGTSYTEGDYIQLTGPLVLYAIWDATPTNLHTFVYSGTLGTFSDSGLNILQMDVYGGTTQTVKSDTELGLTRPDFEFLGWYSALNGQGTKFEVGEEIPISGNVVLYAYWKNLSSSEWAAVFYIDKSTDPWGFVYESDLKLWETYTIKDCTFQKPGYVFAGWYTEVDEETNTYLVGEVITLEYTPVMLYPQWRLEEVTLTYNDNNASSGIVPMGGTYAVDTTITVASSGNLLKYGHDFNGWNTAADGSGTTYQENTSLTLTADTTLYAMWKVDDNGPYSVAYNGNGATSGSVPVDNTSYLKWQTATILGNTGDLAKTGYDFLGWSSSQSATTPEYPVGATVRITGNVTLYAQWGQAPDTTYKTEHYLVGTNSTPVLNYTEYGSGTIGSTVYASSRSYTGYSYNANYAGTVAAGKVAENGSLTLKLYYAINYYTVSFLNWDGTSLATRSVAFGGSAVAPDNPARTGHTFIGWDRAFNNITANTTVVARYSPVTFTVTFVNYNDTVLQASTVNYGGSVAPPANPTRNGFSFTGWDRDSSVWTNVTRDATIRALFDDETTTTPPITQNNVTPNTNDVVTSTLSDEAALSEAAEEQGIPIIGVPLAAPEGFAAWAVLNLIFVFLALAMALIFTLIRNTKRKTLINLRSSGWILTTIGLALASAIVFILTEDMSLPMVWVDHATLASVLFFIAVVVVGNRAIGQKKMSHKSGGSITSEDMKVERTF